jgi:hypothetical protein
MTPEALLAMLAEREIALEEQPRVFESIIPPDRRRFRSQPGGVPTAERLWTDGGARALVEVESDDIVAEIAQQLLAGANVLVDASARLGCLCSGAVAAVPPHQARELVVALEPPRANAPVVDEQATIDLDLPLPAASRTPIDVAAVPGANVPPAPAVVNGPPAAAPRISPPRESPTPLEPKPTRQPNAGSGRPVTGTMPIARDTDGGALAGADVARRRAPAPRAVPAQSSHIPAQPEPSVPLAPAQPEHHVPPVQQAAAIPASDAPITAAPSGDAPSRASIAATPRAPDVAPSGGPQMRYVIYVLVVLAAIAVGISAGVALFVNRSLKSPPAASSAAPPSTRQP